MPVLTWHCVQGPAERNVDLCHVAGVALGPASALIGLTMPETTPALDRRQLGLPF